MSKMDSNGSNSLGPGVQSGNVMKDLSSFTGRAINRKGPLGQDLFRFILNLERRRAERYRKHFVLILFDSRAVSKKANRSSLMGRLASIVSAETRVTDVLGWYEQGVTLGVIFTEIRAEGQISIAEALRSKIIQALGRNLDRDLVAGLVVTAHLFPQGWDQNRSNREASTKPYPDFSRDLSQGKFRTGLKRVMDILGSAGLLVFLSPVLVMIALAVKWSSEGPVIFKQARLGRFGKPFECLKFRTMYTDNDPKAHRDYVQRLIAGGGEGNGSASAAVYKITNDPRVTPIGKFLRKTSFDEFPQFWNVLRGEMSLVGPRPPLPYEFEMYDFWHQSRIFEAKPGITGLWQVCGRSRTCFDDMVRMDLRYARNWSLWLDFKILLATPRAVLSGDGAF
jgi:lipopolysaccharide/colanic/teichoic acid biosynthesis glycosyltransferase